MTTERYMKMVAQLEQLARRSPRGYKFRVFLLAITGLGYYGVVLLISVLLSLLLIAAVIGVAVSGHFPVAAIKIIVVAAIFLFSMSYYMIRALFVKITPPEGVELTPEIAPELFRVLDNLRIQLDLPALKKVILNEEHNASAIQIPKYFLIGPTHHYLVVGFPLMDSLTPEQFKSVLGHELGHLSGNHAAFSNWIYRIRSMYGRLYRMLEEGQRSDIFMRWFTKSYVPYFDAYSFVLARDNEYDADRAAASVSSPRDAAQALVNIHVLARQLDNKFWPDVYKKTAYEVLPPQEIMTDMRNYWSKFDQASAGVCLEQDFKQPASPYQTHPSLSARLKSLGFTADQTEDILSLFNLPDPDGLCAAQVYLGESYKNLQNQISSRWTDGVKSYWAAEHASLEKVRTDLQENEALNDPDFDALLERTQLFLRLDERDKAEALLAELLETNAEHPLANFSMGWILLKRDDAAGIDYLRKIDATAAPDLVSATAELACGYLDEHGQADEAKELSLKLQGIYQQAALHQAKRKELTQKTVLVQHDLPLEKLATLTDQLLDSPLVKKAWLAKKQIEGHSVYVLLLERKKAFIEISEEKAVQAFLRSLRVEMPAQGTMILLHKNNKWLLKKMRKVSGSEIFERK